MSDPQENDQAKLWELIGDIRLAMLTTRHSNGHLHARPLTTQNTQDDKDARLWFFVSRSGDSIQDLSFDTNVNVAYAHPGKDSYVSVSGTASIVEDAAKKRALWSSMNEAWFPAGVDDPDLALLRIDITHAHYWDIRESKIVQALKMTMAAATGHGAPDLGEQGEVRMR
jgi:general stress protein 26